MIHKLKELLKCPLDWETLTNCPYEESILQADWHYAIGAMVADRDDIPYGDFAFEDYTDDEIAYAVHALNERQREIKQFYKSKCAYRLYYLDFIAPVQQAAKHSVKKLHESQLLANTKYGKPSLFLKTIDGNYLRQQFWNWAICYFDHYADRDSYHAMMDPDEETYNEAKGKLWRRFLNAPHTRLSWRFDQPIGASNGALTSFVCYDIHLDTNVAHCFPVPEDEAEKIMGDAPLVTSDEHCRPLDK